MKAMNNTYSRKIEVEGNELAIKNSNGDIAIIPKKDRSKIKEFISKKLYDKIDSYVKNLPKYSDYAKDGTLIKSGNKEAQEMAYSMAVAKGYKKSLEDFMQLLREDEEALNMSFTLASQNGYKKSIEDYSQLLGLKKKDDESALPSEAQSKSDVYKEALLNSRKAVRKNPDGTESTVLMTSIEADGRYYAVPTLYPKDPNNQTENPDDWEELVGYEALDRARERGELYEFDTDEEARAFAEGSWKEPIDESIDKPNDELSEEDDDTNLLKSALAHLGKGIEDLGWLVKTVEAEAIKAVGLPPVAGMTPEMVSYARDKSSEKYQQHMIKREQGFLEAIGNGDFGEAMGIAVEATAESLPIMALAAVSGGVSVASYAVVSSTSAGITYMDSKNEEWFKDMSSWGKFGYLSAMGAFESIGEATGGKIINRAITEVAQNASERIFKESLKDVLKGYFNGIGKSLGRDYSEEALAEGVTGMGQTITDMIARGEELDIGKILYNTAESMALGGTMGGMIGGTTRTLGSSVDAIAVANKMSNVRRGNLKYVSKKYTEALQEDSPHDEIAYWQEKFIETVRNKNKRINRYHQLIKTMADSDKETLDRSLTELEDIYSKVRSSKSDEYKAELLKERDRLVSEITSVVERVTNAPSYKIDGKKLNTRDEFFQYVQNMDKEQLNNVKFDIENAPEDVDLLDNYIKFIFDGGNPGEYNLEAPSAKEEPIVEPIKEESDEEAGMQEAEGRKEEVASIEETSPNYANMTEDGEGNFVFYHAGKPGYEAIDPKKSGTNRYTPADERGAMGRVGGMSMFYTNEGDKETMVGGGAMYEVKVPKEKVYDAESDPLNLFDKAKEQAKAEGKPLAGTNQVYAMMTKLANEAGFDMVVMGWKDTKTRAQTTKPLTPTDTQISKGNVIETPFKQTYKSNNKNYRSIRPPKRHVEWSDLYMEIRNALGKIKDFGSAFNLASTASGMTEAEVKKVINDNPNIPQELKDEFNERTKIPLPKAQSVRVDNIEGVEAVAPTMEEDAERKEYRTSQEYIKKIIDATPKTSLSEVKRILKGTFALLTGENPRNKAYDEETNKKLNEKAVEWLKAKGYNPVPTAGIYNQGENSFLVENMTTEDAIEFANIFKQESVAHSEGMLYADGTMNPRVKTEDKFALNEYTEGDNMVSTFKTDEGLRTMSVGYDWGSQIPVGGKTEQVAAKKPETKQKKETKKKTKDETASKEEQAKLNALKAMFLPTDVDSKLVSKIEEQIKFALNALSNIIPDLKIVTHYTVDEYANATGGTFSSAGTYMSGTNTIHINMAMASDTTVAHEAFHAILWNSLKTNSKVQEVTRDMLMSLQATLADTKNPLASLINQFLEDGNYESSVQNEEALAQLFGLIVNNYGSLTAPQKSFIRTWIDKILDLLGLSKIRTEDTVELLNTLAGKFQNNEIIKERDIRLLRERTVKTRDLITRNDKVGKFNISYFADTDEFMAKHGDNIEFDYDLSDLPFGTRIVLHSPDNMITGEVSIGDISVRGTGGIMQPFLFDDVWAVGGKSTAVGISNAINESIELSDDGVGRLFMVTGSPKKLFSNKEGVNSAIEIMESFVNEGVATISEFRAALNATVKEASSSKMNFSHKGADSAKAIAKDIKREFLNNDSITFPERKAFLEKMIVNLAGAIRNNDKDEKAVRIQKFRDLFGNQDVKTITKETIGDGIARVLTERILVGLPSNQVYAVIESRSKVYPVEAPKGSSFAWQIKTEDGSPVKIRLLKDRIDVFNSGLFTLADGRGRNNFSSEKVWQSTLIPGQAGYGRAMYASTAVREQRSKLPPIDEVRARAKKEGISDSAINGFLKQMGYTEQEIRESATSPSEIPGYERMMANVRGIIFKSNRRGASIRKSFDNAMQYMMKSLVYEKASDIQRETMVRELNRHFNFRLKSAAKTMRPLESLKYFSKLELEERENLVGQLKMENKRVTTAIAKRKAISLALIKAMSKMVKKGQITQKQMIAVLRKTESTDFFNDDSIRDFVDYMAKVFSKSDYLNKVGKIRGKLKNARKAIKSRIGVSPRLAPLLSQLFSIDPLKIPSEVFDSYEAMVNMMSERKAVLNLDDVSEMINNAQEILQAVIDKYATLDILKNRYQNYESKVIDKKTDKVDYARTIRQMLEEDVLSIEEYELMRENRPYVLDIEPNTNKQKTEEEKAKAREANLKKIKQAKIDVSKLSMRDERDLANEIARLIKTKAIESLSDTDLNALVRVIDNINNGFVTHMALILKETMTSSVRGKNGFDVVKDGSLSRLESAYSRMKTMFSKDNNVFLKAIERNPLFFIDQIFGDYSGKRLFNAIFEPLASAYSRFKSEISTVEEMLNNAHNNLLKSYKFNSNKVVKAKYRITAYLIELEYKSNPGNEEVNKAADFIKATIEAFEKNPSSVNYNQRDIDALTEILAEFDSDGNIDMDKMYESFTPAEKALIEAVQVINNSISDKAAYTAAVIRGKAIKPRENYVHLKVSATYGNTDIDNNESIAQKFIKYSQISTKAKSLQERTGNVNPIDFDIVSSVLSGAKQTLIDYHMTIPVRESSRTIKTMRELANDKSLGDSGQTPLIVDALERAKNDVLQHVLNASFNNNSFVDRAINEINKAGYRAMLGSITRATAEFLSNVFFALTMAPTVLKTGLKNYEMMGKYGLDVLKALNSTQITRLYPTTTLHGRMIDIDILNKAGGIGSSTMNNDVVNVINVAYNYSVKRLLKNPAEFIADTLITTPDKIIARPIWVGSFDAKFKELTGESPDYAKIAQNDQQYMNANRDALKISTEAADQASILASASDNPFLGVTKNNIYENDSALLKMFKMFNGFMTRFIIYEFTAARTGIHAMMNNDLMSKSDGAKLLAAVSIRTTSYMLLSTMLSSALIGAIAGALGVDDDEEDEKGLLQRTGQAIGTSVTSLILGRNFGNLTRGLISMPVEYVNKEYLDFLREGEYDPYKDALTYNSLAPGKKHNDNIMWEVLKNMSGAYSPFIESLDRTIEVAQRNPKKQDAIERRKKELMIRTPFELLGLSGLIPFYSDTRKILMRYLYQDLEKGNEGGGMTINELKTYYPEIYKELYETYPEFRQQIEIQKEMRKHQRELNKIKKDMIKEALE